jgi:hypothetical protein
MKKFAIAALAVGSVVLLGVILVVVFPPSVTIVDHGGYTESEVRVMKHSCDGDRATVTIRFAKHAGRVGPMNNRLANRDPEGCMVVLLVPKGAGADPMEVIDEAVSPRGWERKGEAAWVNAEGFTVTAAPGSQPWADPSMVEYEVTLKGSPR